MKILISILICLSLFGAGYYSGRYHSSRLLQVCRDDLTWAVKRGVTLEANLDLCNQGKK